MKKPALIVGLFFLHALPLSATITEIQHPQTGTGYCSTTTTTCTLNVAATGTRHFGIVMITLLSSKNTWVTSVTDNKGGAWTVPGSSGSGGCYQFYGTYGSTGCAYNLALPAGVTQITGTWSSPIPEGAEFEFREFAYTGPSVSLDSIGTFAQPNGIPGPTITGISPSLSGTNDVIVQSFASGSDYASAVSVYGNANLHYAWFGSADLLNTTSTAPPVFTVCCNTTIAYAFIYVAIKENPGIGIHSSNLAGMEEAPHKRYVELGAVIPATQHEN